MAAEILRIKYSRGESVKYVSHLDFVKVFERAIRRAGICAAFSKGFNPRMLLVFGNPLPVGYLSDCELMDLELERPCEAQEVVKALSEKLPSGIGIVSAEELSKPYPSILSTLCFAEYVLGVTCDPEGSEPKMNAVFQNSAELVTLKRTKSGEKLTDIKPMIKAFDAKDGFVYVTAATGIGGNLRPELAVKCIAGKAGITVSVNSIRKTAMY